MWSQLRGFISDFGLSSCLESGTSAITKSSFAHAWSSPETFNHNKYSKHTDTWTYGVFVWELFSNALEFHEPWKNTIKRLHAAGELTSTAITPHNISRSIDREHRPHIHEKVPHPIKQLMLKCWRAKPPRLSMKECEAGLRKLLDANECMDWWNLTRTCTGYSSPPRDTASQRSRQSEQEPIVAARKTPPPSQGANLAEGDMVK